MSDPSSDFSKRLAQLTGENVEVLLKNDKIIVGELLSVSGVFFIRGDSVVAIKKGDSTLE